jgi:hypothetical protein
MRQMLIAIFCRRAFMCLKSCLDIEYYRHVLTAIGEYLTVMAGTCVVLAIQEGHPNFGFGRGYLGFPYVRRTGPYPGSKKVQ